jgi:Na+-translocating ferredoxin:NAD+ oxidoreductase RnfG subunit
VRRRSSLVWSLAPAAALYAPAPAFAADYLTAEQAQEEIFPGATFEKRELALTPDERHALEQRLGGPLRDRWVLRVARRGGQVVGALVVDDVIGKFERITYAVGVGDDGAVRDVEILTYRESHGHEVRLPSWRKQFVGKGPSAPLRVGEDISNISGATLSCHHVTEGVRRIVNVVDAFRRRGALG